MQASARRAKSNPGADCRQRQWHPPSAATICATATTNVPGRPPLVHSCPASTCRCAPLPAALPARPLSTCGLLSRWRRRSSWLSKRSQLALRHSLKIDTRQPGPEHALTKSPSRTVLVRFNFTVYTHGANIFVNAKCFARIGPGRILVGLDDVYVSPDPESD